MPPCQPRHRSLDKNPNPNDTIQWDGDYQSTSDSKEGRKVYLALTVMIFVWCICELVHRQSGQNSALVVGHNDTHRVKFGMIRTGIDPGTPLTKVIIALYQFLPATLPTTPPGLGKISMSEWRNLKMMSDKAPFLHIRIFWLIRIKIRPKRICVRFHLGAYKLIVKRATSVNNRVQLTETESANL